MIPTLLMALCSLTFDAAIHVAATSIPSSTNRILHGGRLPFSPRGNARPGSFDRDRTRDNRVLEASDSITSYLVDENGNEYEPYSLAWRYLGMYIDCDIEQANGKERRFLEDSGGACERVLLWAAYVDPKYQGGSIGEYQFYDWTTGTWDASTCKTRRCAKMDCHEPNTHFKLVGVFKESGGMVDWAEQLFKHEGYCVWNNSTYSFMQNHREYWPTSCLRASVADLYGDTLYMHVLPEGDGNMTIGVFSDDKCTEESTTTTFSDYVVMYYVNNFGSEEKGAKAALSWENSFETWNEYMNTYKICQPCRAYSLNMSERSSQNGEGRYLENDGDGDEEQWGYNCYDAAGYTNCNQCYKFETQTDLEVASTEDLARASQQGTILEIMVNGKKYGSGGFRSPPPDNPSFKVIALTLGLGLLGVGMLVGGILFVFWRRSRQRRLHELLASFHENCK